MKTFHVSTLGCKVNHYESEQVATLLRARGLVQVDRAEQADLRIVNTCSVTVQAASKSRQTVRQVVRLPVLGDSDSSGTLAGEKTQVLSSQRLIVIGCWATSDREAASKLPGVSAVITHHDDVAQQLDRLLLLWHREGLRPPKDPTELNLTACKPPPEPLGDNGWMNQASAPATALGAFNKSSAPPAVKRKLAELSEFPGASRLPLLDAHQDTRQRGFLKVQDGCDAHCTYCIIPTLRPRLWSKPIPDIVEEARRLVDRGHVELVLTGIFLGAYGQPTALRRRHSPETGNPLGNLVQALCTQIPQLRRLRLSSLEPGDLDDQLLAILRSFPQVVPHFHLPLQSGSNSILRRMNRQYGREDFLRMVDRVNAAFDRPALTTDIIVAFPGETDEEFSRTLEVVDYARFIHIHAFPFSPRPGTAAARWKKDFVHGPVANLRIDVLKSRAAIHSLAFRRQFLGQSVELLVERNLHHPADHPTLRHGRCERYFSVLFEDDAAKAGDAVRVRISRVSDGRTFGLRQRDEQVPGS